MKAPSCVPKTAAFWQRCAIPPGAEHLDFRGVQAFDANTAIVMSSGKGDLSRLYKTTDGCHTWKLVFTNPDPDGFWDALQMSFKAPWVNGMLIGDPAAGQFPIFVTSDGGESWRRWGHKAQTGCKEEKAPASKGESLSAASNESAVFDPGSEELDTKFVTGGNSASRFTYSDENDWDGSLCSVRFKSWKLDFSQRGSSAGPFALAESGTGANEIFVAVGGDHMKPDIPSDSFLIRQKFANFRLPYMVSIFREAPIRSTTPPHGFRSAVAYDTAARTWITVGPNGTDISTDDGRNWRALRPDSGVSVRRPSG